MGLFVQPSQPCGIEGRPIAEMAGRQITPVPGRLTPRPPRLGVLKTITNSVCGEFVKPLESVRWRWALMVKRLAT